MDKKIREQLEGSVSVNGDVTPITREPIQKVNSNQWKVASEGVLFDQLDTLRQRRALASMSGMSSDVLKQIDAGIAQLEAVLRSKQQEDTMLV